MCILNIKIINHDRKKYSTYLCAYIFTSTYSWCFYSNDVRFVIVSEITNTKMKTFCESPLLAVATYFRINHEGNINSAAYVSAYFMNHFASQAIRFRMQKAKGYAEIFCGKIVFDYINLSPKSSVSNNLLNFMRTEFCVVGIERNSRNLLWFTVVSTHNCFNELVPLSLIVSIEWQRNVEILILADFMLYRIINTMSDLNYCDRKSSVIV